MPNKFKCYVNCYVALLRESPQEKTIPVHKSCIFSNSFASQVMISTYAELVDVEKADCIHEMNFLTYCQSHVYSPVGVGTGSKSPSLSTK